jgi:hypothetical protein
MNDCAVVLVDRCDYVPNSTECFSLSRPLFMQDNLITSSVLVNEKKKMVFYLVYVVMT